jgi:hypothetical protein
LKRPNSRRLKCDARGETIAIKTTPLMFVVLGPYKPIASFDDVSKAKIYVYENWFNFVLKITNLNDEVQIFINEKGL